jgi:GT2 family glycosyltransferase
VVSGVLCVHNGAATLDGQLAALAAQDFDGCWELVVVDNASTDASRDIAAAWASRMPYLRVVAEPHVGLNRARNRGVRTAAGSLIVVCDADDEVTPGWVRAMVAGLQQFDVVGGALEPLTNPKSHWRRDDCPQRDDLPAMLGRPFAMGANLGFTRHVFDAVGGFDDAFVLGADEVDFCLRAQYAGCTIGFVPDAIVHYRTKESARRVMRQWYGYGVGHQRLVEKHTANGWISSTRPQRWSAVGRNVASSALRLPEGVRRASRYAYLASIAHVAGEAVELARRPRTRARVV